MTRKFNGPFLGPSICADVRDVVNVLDRKFLLVDGFDAGCYSAKGNSTRLLGHLKLTRANHVFQARRSRL